MLLKTSKISEGVHWGHRVLTLLILVTLLVCAGSIPAIAEAVPPTAFGAPEHIGVSTYYGDALYFTLTAPEDIRTFMKERYMEDPDNKRTLTLHFQIDYRVDQGDWHYSSEWDSPKTAPENPKDQLYFSFLYDAYYYDSERWSMSSLFPDEEAFKQLMDSGWDYFGSHSMTFRIRFAETFDYGETYVLSPWSKEYTLSSKVIADYNNLINHAPTLLSAEVKKRPDGEPYFNIQAGKVPDEVQDLNAMAGSTMSLEIWMRRAADKEFKLVNPNEWFFESVEIDASEYFDNTKQNYDAESYEIKVRYRLDLREYKQAGYSGNSNSVYIYSPFSNVISHNMPSWSGASAWALGELEKAKEFGIIPEILKGADMAKPITREEFAELAVMLYEKVTGTMATPASPNPFKDTTNPQILKAFKLGITTGTSATTFAPKEFTNREQVAAMLSRTIRIMAPNGDFSTNGAPDFLDKKDISSWAMEHVLFMAKSNIIKGVNGKFMPKAVTTAQKATGYATTTREQAIAMSVRSYEQMDSIEKVAPTTPQGSSSGNAAKTNPSSDKGILGTWMYTNSSGSVGLAIMYEFKENGTFSKAIGSVAGSSYNSTAFEGKYKITSNKLTLYDQKKSTGYASSWNELWRISQSLIKDIPVEDNTYTFSMTVDGKLVIGDTEYSLM